MKRMTSSNYNPCVNCIYSSSCSHIKHNDPVCPERARYDRLAAIEDILGDEYDLERLRELDQADREGRCVVLPCKIGQKVYDITSGEVIEKSVVSIPFLLSKSINHLCLHAINQRDAITEIGTQDFGKTVFFTRAEAQAALRREQDGNNK